MHWRCKVLLGGQWEVVWSGPDELSHLHERKWIHPGTLSGLSQVDQTALRRLLNLQPRRRIRLTAASARFKCVPAAFETIDGAGHRSVVAGEGGGPGDPAGYRRCERRHTATERKRLEPIDEMKR